MTLRNHIEKIFGKECDEIIRVLENYKLNELVDDIFISLNQIDRKTNEDALEILSKLNFSFFRAAIKCLTDLKGKPEIGAVKNALGKTTRSLLIEMVSLLPGYYDNIIAKAEYDVRRVSYAFGFDQEEILGVINLRELPKEKKIKNRHPPQKKNNHVMIGKALPGKGSILRVFYIRTTIL